MPRLKKAAENLALLMCACIVTPFLLVFTLVGFCLSIPTFLREMPWNYLWPRPRRFLRALVMLGLKFVYEFVTTIGFAKVFFGSSVASDTHPRGWQLPYRLRVTFRLLLTLQRYFGMLRLPRLEKRVRSKILAWCQAHPPTEKELYLDIPRVKASDITPEEFCARFVKDPHPVILEGLNADSHAVRHWDLAYFRKYADDLAPVTRTGSDSDPVQKSSLGEYLDYMEDNQHLEVHERASPKYLANFANLCNNHPELVDELDVRKMAAYLRDAGQSDLAGVHIFLGLGGTATPFHCANTMNWFFQVRGQKKWTFVHPEHMALMYPVATSDVFYAGSVMEYPEPSQEVMDLDFPLWRYCPRYEAVLNPGDVLLNPSWWWHRIINESSPTIGCASRWVLLPPMKTNTLFDFFLTFNPHFLSNLMVLIGKRSNEPRLTDETTLTIKQRLSRANLAVRLNAKRPSMRNEPVK